MKITYWLFVLTLCVVAIFVCFYFLTKSGNNLSSSIDGVQRKLDSIYLSFDTVIIPEQVLLIQDAQLELQKERLQLELESKKQELFWSNIIFLGIGSVLGFIWLLFALPKEIEKKAKAEVDEKIGDAIRGRSDVIRRMVHKYDYESNLCASKKLVIMGESENNNIITKILEENFVNNIDDISYGEVLNKNAYDVLFLNNIDGKYISDSNTEEENHIKPIKWDDVIKTIEKLPEHVCVFYFCELPSGRFPMEKIKVDLKKRVNFANSLSQIYGNLLNTLKYQDKIPKR